MVIRKVASSPIITISALTPNKKMMHHPSSSRRSSTRTSTGGHRRQITPDSVVGTNILCSQSFADDYRSSSTAAADDDNHGGGGRRTTVSNNTTSNPLRPNASSSSPTTSSCRRHSPQIEHQSLQLLSILTLESSPHYTISPHYLHSSILLKETGVSEKCRRKTCEWMYELCDYFQLHREVVGIALFYVDRYFTITFGGGGESSSHHHPVSKRDFQLIGLTALYIAIKTHGQSRQCAVDTNDSTSSSDAAFNKLKFSLHICASTSRQQFTARQIEETECLMLQTLGWRLNPIVPSGCVIELLVMFLPCAMDSEHDGGSGGESSRQSVVQNFVYDCATYLTELAVSVAALSLVYKPSVIAYASVLAAVDLLLEDDSSSMSSSSSSSRVTEDTLIEYDALLNQASCQHFERNKDEVVKAKEILGVMAPNVGLLFPSPFGEPTPTTFVGPNELL
jgi:hypothetical protein